MHVFLFLPPQPSLFLSFAPQCNQYSAQSQIQTCQAVFALPMLTHPRRPSQAKHSLWPEISFGGISSSGSSLLQTVSFFLFPLSFSFWVFSCTLPPWESQTGINTGGWGWGQEGLQDSDGRWVQNGIVSWKYQETAVKEREAQMLMTQGEV